MVSLDSVRGQSALEYLLLIGGAVLVATIILIIILGGVFPASGQILNSNLELYRQGVSIGGSNGGNHCGNGVYEPELGEECDPSATGTYCYAACTSDCACTL